MSSRKAFLLLTIAVIGLGDVWRFPSLVFNHGGGAFVLVYVLGLVLVAAPLLVAEFKLGQIGSGDPYQALLVLRAQLGLARAWPVMAGLWLLAAIALLSFYGVIAGWSLGYVLRAAGGQLDNVSAAQAGQRFLELAADGERSLAWYTIFWVIIGAVSARGLQRGLIRAATVILPLLLVMLGALLGQSLSAGSDAGGMARVLAFDVQALGWRGVLAALSQACYSVSLGLAMIYVIGSQLGRPVHALWLAGGVIAVDLLFGLAMTVALAAGGAAAGQTVDSGVRLLFVALPTVISAGSGLPLLPLYLLASLLAAGSALMLMEPLVQVAQHRWHLTRVRAATGVTLLVWTLGLLSLVSFATWSSLSLFGRNPVEWLQYLAADILIPVNCLLLAVFVGRVLPPSLVATSGPEGVRALAIWHVLLLYPARLSLIAIFIYLSGIADWMVRFWSV